MKINSFISNKKEVLSRGISLVWLGFEVWDFAAAVQIRHAPFFSDE